MNAGTRTAREDLEPADLNEYAGVYWTGELETEYTILARNGNCSRFVRLTGKFGMERINGL